MYEDFLKRDSYLNRAEEWGFLPLVQEHHATDKIARIINRISPLVEFGKLRFQKGHSDQDLLVEQLIYILDPNVNDDGPDALEGAVALVQKSWMGPVGYESVSRRGASKENKGPGDGEANAESTRING